LQQRRKQKMSAGVSCSVHGETRRDWQNARERNRERQIERKR